MSGDRTSLLTRELAQEQIDACKKLFQHPEAFRRPHPSNECSNSCPLINSRRVRMCIESGNILETHQCTPANCDPFLIKTPEGNFCSLSGRYYPAELSHEKEFFTLGHTQTNREVVTLVPSDDDDDDGDNNGDRKYETEKEKRHRKRKTMMKKIDKEEEEAESDEKKKKKKKKRANKTVVNPRKNEIYNTTGNELDKLINQAMTIARHTFTTLSSNFPENLLKDLSLAACHYYIQFKKLFSDEMNCREYKFANHCMGMLYSSRSGNDDELKVPKWTPYLQQLVRDENSLASRNVVPRTVTKAKAAFRSFMERGIEKTADDKLVYKISEWKIYPETDFSQHDCVTWKAEYLLWEDFVSQLSNKRLS